ncbi:MAG TPA: RimK family alpha-L-glutamate ligase [Candidatus Saccharimonadales bacterium]|nr:RimK family alpha-L-glutamate ligase [Candidatus Saccharimonadales bacterium]
MKIGVLTNWPNSDASQRLVAVAKARGHEAYALEARRCYVEVAGSGHKVHYNGEILKGFDAIIPRFTQSATSYGAAVVRQFEVAGVYTVTSSLAINRVSDKLRTMQLMARKGIETPKTVFAWQPKASKDLIQLVGGVPLIIKLVEGSQGSGVVLAETEKAAQSVIQAFAALRANFILQEYIKESNGSDIRAFVVGSKVVASMQRQGLESEFRSNIHLGGSAVSVKLTEEERKIAVRAAKATGLPVCGVDILRSDRGPLVLEVNSAPGLEIEKITNRNVSEKIIEYIELNAKRKQRKDRIGA